MKYIASVSFGKDSLAMLLRLLEEKWPLDEVVFYNTGMEFRVIYEIRDQVKKLLEGTGIRFIELEPDYDFEWQMFERPVNGPNGFHLGYSWCGGRCRWGTTDKIKICEEYCKGVYEYVGIAADEKPRLKKERKGNKVFPLAEWKMTEADCLNFCYERGFTWTEDAGAGPIRLYDVLKRVSCWCCCNKNLDELRNMRKYLPHYWQELERLQRKTERPMKGAGKSVFELGHRFEMEDLIVKKSDIKIGHTYTDGKGRMRLVTDMGPQYILYPGQISTENLQYKIVNDGTKKNRKAGELHNMTLVSFSQWCKEEVLQNAN